MPTTFPSVGVMNSNLFYHAALIPITPVLPK